MGSERPARQFEQECRLQEIFNSNDLESEVFATLAPDLLSKSCVRCSAGEHPRGARLRGKVRRPFDTAQGRFPWREVSHAEGEGSQAVWGVLAETYSLWMNDHLFTARSRYSTNSRAWDISCTGRRCGDQGLWAPCSMAGCLEARARLQSFFSACHPCDDQRARVNLDRRSSGCKVRVDGQAIQYCGGRGRKQTVQLDLRLGMRNG